MSIKLVDSLSPMGSFPVAEAKDIVFADSENLQQKLDDGTLGSGGSGTSYIELSEEEYFALSDEQRAGEVEYRTYDTGRIFKRGVEYGKDGVQISDNETVKDKTWSSKKTSDEIAKVETELKGNIEELSSNLGEKVDYKVVVEDGSRYVEDVVTQDINTWLPNDNSSILINLKKTNGINYLNFQLLCNKKDSKNWSCIVNGAANELWKIRYIDGVRYIDELATMDNVNASLGELCNKKIYCGEAWGTIVNGFISARNPIGKAGNVIATMKYLSKNNPVGYSITTQVTLSTINFYFRWHRESDDTEAYPPDGTEIVISYMIFY